ncbi:MAG: type II toxin-antitoxin system VapB family antitoxin [Nitrospiria bacterium]
MRTTLDLDEKLIEALLKVTDAKTKTEAIHLAISELIRRRRLEKLKSLSGKIHIDLDLKKMKKVELEHQKRLARRLRGHR